MLIAPQGQDILFDEKRCEIGRNFMNKLWNAARFVQMQRGTNPPSRPHNAHDLKILFEMNDAIAKVSAALDVFRFSEAAKELYDFVWADFCDWYIEASKLSPSLPVLEEALSVILRLLHPFAPFITEELWNGTGRTDTIQFAPWPQPREVAGATAEHSAKVETLYELVTAGRYLRNQYRIDPKQKLEFVIKPNANEDLFRDEIVFLKMFLNAEQVKLDRNYRGGGTGWVANSATIFMVGTAAVEAEKTALIKQLDDVEKQLAATDAKLANENFVAKAAPIAVEREREKQRTLREQREKVQALLRSLQ
jgi:valyl-tRNA synthetase